MTRNFILEEARRVPVAAAADVVVCGGGPAGVCAAVAAARAGAKTILLERSGQLGGIMTGGMMSNVIGSEGKQGLIREILNDLTDMGARGDRLVFEPEIVKFYLEQLCLKAGVKIRLHTMVTAAVTDSAHRLRTVITESKSGREAWQGKIFIDCTGDGDLAAMAGCGFDLGRDQDHELQPLSFCAMIYGVQAESIPEMIRIAGDAGKKNLREFLTDYGCPPSYEQPTLFRLSNENYLLMSNHQYHVNPMDADALTDAVLEARAELFRQVECLRENDLRFAEVKIGSTADCIGVREGRRIHGLYRVTREDMEKGRKHEDAICQMTCNVDVHSTAPEKHKGYSQEDCTVVPYDIPLRALIAADVRGLLMAGRCISGDFHAHASYRVLGGAMPMGEAAGVCAALAAAEYCLPEEVEFTGISRILQ